MRTCEQGRTSLVRVFAENPGITPGSGFKPPHDRLERKEIVRWSARPEREAGKGVRRREQTACCLPGRHSLNGACFCAVKSCSCCARSTRAGGCSRESDMRMVLVLLTSLRSFSSFWHGIARKRSLLVLRASVAIKSTEKAATMSRVFCTFFPQKSTQKLPGRCLRLLRPG